MAPAIKPTMCCYGLVGRQAIPGMVAWKSLLTIGLAADGTPKESNCLPESFWQHVPVCGNHDPEY